MLLSQKMAWLRPYCIFLHFQMPLVPVYMSFLPLILQQCEKQGVENNFILTGEQHRYRHLTHFRAANLLKNLEQYSAHCTVLVLCLGQIFINRPPSHTVHWLVDLLSNSFFPLDHQQKRVINFVLSYLIDFMDQSKIIFGQKVNSLETSQSFESKCQVLKFESRMQKQQFVF